uniref:Uncharacterized protein n=1 Tax=Arundo donax TaxID=35708 RepID=A0A0A9G4L6_ARUDO
MSPFRFQDCMLRILQEVLNFGTGFKYKTSSRF